MRCSGVFVCLRVCFLRGVCNGDQEKVNYLLVLRCRLASPGWAGSSGVREREREMEGKKEREGREGKSQVSTETKGATVTRHSGKRASEMWR